MKKFKLIIAATGILLLLSACDGGDGGGGGGGGDGDGGDGGGYTVGGTIEYLGIPSGTVVLSNDNGTSKDTLTLSAGEATFTFATALASGSTYFVSGDSFTVDNVSKGWACKATSNSSGTISADVTDVAITCGRDVKMNPISASASTIDSEVTMLFQADDSNGNPLSGLVVDDFTVTEDGDALTTESHVEIVPRTDLDYELRTVLAIDISTSISSADLTLVKAAASNLVKNSATGASNLLANQKIAVYVFDGEVTLIQDFTDDHEALDAAINDITQAGRSAGSTTNLYQAVITGVGRWTDQVSASIVRQGSMIIMTDGKDTSGITTLDAALGAIGDKNVYAVGIESADFDQNAALELENIGTAGYYTATGFTDLGVQLQLAAQQLADKVDSFYYLRYSSPYLSGTHSVELTVNDNVYVGDGFKLTTSYNSSTYITNAKVELDSKQINILPNGTTISSAAVIWDNATSYDYLWEITTGDAFVIEDSPDNTATVTGGSIAGNSTLLVSTTDNVGNNITNTASVNVTEVTVNSTATWLALGESATLTATSTNEFPYFAWSDNSGACTISGNGNTVTLIASTYTEGVCTVAVSDNGVDGSYIPAKIDIIVGSPDATELIISSVSGGTFYQTTSDEDFESGVLSGALTMLGDASWSIDSTTGANETQHSAVSGQITDNQFTAMELTAQAGTVSFSFYYKVSSELDYDFLSYYVDGVFQQSWSGDQDWTYQSHSFDDTSVDHTIRWQYSKDYAVSAGSDAAWVDEITLH